MLGKDQKSLAFTFFRPADVSDGKLSGQSFRQGTTGAPILIDVPGAIECRVISLVEQGDHPIIVGNDLAMRSSGRDMGLLDRSRRAGRGRAAFTDCHPRRQTRLLAGDLQPAQTRRLLPPLPAIDAPGRDSHGKPWGRLPFWQRARIGAPFS